MSTITQALAEEIIAGDGYYLDDTRVAKVVKYDNAWGGKAWAILYPHQNRYMYEQSPHCSNVQTLWEDTP